jgi:uncharacterized integral membrane protein
MDRLANNHFALLMAKVQQLVLDRRSVSGFFLPQRRRFLKIFILQNNNNLKADVTYIFIIYYLLLLLLLLLCVVVGFIDKFIYFL